MGSKQNLPSLENGNLNAESFRKLTETEEGKKRAWRVRTMETNPFYYKPQLYGLSLIVFVLTVGMVHRLLPEEHTLSLGHSLFSKRDNDGASMKHIKSASHLSLKISVYQPGGRFEEENNQRIFFHESSGNKFLNVRQTCAVESAAMHNPQRSIQLFLHTLDQLNPCSQWYKVLAKYPNVEVVLVDNDSYFADSPFHEVYMSNLRNSKKEEYVDYLKMLTIYKGGGMSLELDFIFLRPFSDKFSNFFVLEDSMTGFVAFSAFHLKHGHRLIQNLTRKMIKGSYSMLSDSRGSATATLTLLEMCGKTRKHHQHYCPDVKILDHISFIPIVFENRHLIFGYNLSLDSILVELKKSYALYGWSNFTHNWPVTFDFNQTYSHLAKAHCPKTVEVAGQFS